MGLIKSGIEQGANLKCGGKRFGTQGYFVEPTVFSDVKDDMRIAREEVISSFIAINYIYYCEGKYKYVRTAVCEHHTAVISVILWNFQLQFT